MQRMPCGRSAVLLVVLLGGAFGATSGEQAASAREASLGIRSAKRTERFDDRFTKLTLRDPAKDVILLLDLAGISLTDFNATPVSEVFLMAGDRRFEPSLRTAGDWQRPDATGVTEDRWLVVIVPRDTLVFRLYFGKQSPIVFTADTAVASILP